jgi:hypothetical protein
LFEELKQRNSKKVTKDEVTLPAIGHGKVSFNGNFRLEVDPAGYVI